MDKDAPLSLADRIAAAQAWWRAAGVDHAYLDEPQALLAEETPSDAVAAAAPVAEKPAAPPRARIGGDSSGWPEDLAGFRSWWLSDPSLGDFGATPRVPPRGKTGDALMLLVPMPEAGDSEVLCSGPEGRLLASLAIAMGLSPDAIYLASALPRHTALPDWDRLNADGLGEILKHHIGLANPQRLMVLGTRILPLLGHDPAQAAPGVSELTIQDRKIPVLASYAPDRLLGSARQRASLWRCWLDWTDEGAR